MTAKLVFLLLLFAVAKCSHFRGGQITWKPVSDNGATVTVQFTARWSWRLGSYPCTDTTIASNTLIGPTTGIVCDTGCKVMGESIGTTQFYCTKYSNVEDWTMGERIWTYTVPKTADYEASFTGGAWISLNVGGGNWEVRVMLNTLVRSDTGAVNTSPVTSMAPVVRLRLGFNHKFSIPYADADGDDVRCRYSDATKGECSGVCNGIPTATLTSSCDLIFAANAAGWYAAAIQLEDFKTTTDTVPMSSVGLQFLIYVLSVTSSCTIAPVVLGDRAAGACIAVPLGTTVTERIVAQVGCSSVSLYDIQVIGPTGTTQSGVSQIPGTTDEYYVTLTWTPIASQMGPNVICAKAIDNTFLSSDNHCFTLLAGITPPALLPGTGTPSGLLTGATLAGNNGVITWTIKFNKGVIRPTKSSYISFYKSDGTVLFQMDAAVFPTVNYNGAILTFETGNSFESGSYYILFDYGAGLGSEYCKAESDAVKDPTFWTFSIAATTTTTLATAIAPVTVPGATLGFGGLSATASPILPVGATTTTLASTSGSGGASTVGSTGTVSSTVVSTTGTTGSTTVGTTSSNSISTNTTTTKTTTLTTLKYTSECNLTSFVITLSCIWLGGILLNLASLVGILLFLKVNLQPYIISNII